MTDIRHLNRVVELERERNSYEFDLFGIFYDPALRHYLVGYDSGCSCPVAWEDHQIQLIGPMTWKDARGVLDSEGMTHDNANEGWFADAYQDARRRLTEHAEAHGLTEV